MISTSFNIYLLLLFPSLTLSVKNCDRKCSNMSVNVLECPKMVCSDQVSFLLCCRFGNFAFIRRLGDLFDDTDSHCLSHVTHGKSTERWVFGK